VNRIICTSHALSLSLSLSGILLSPIIMMSLGLKNTGAPKDSHPSASPIPKSENTTEMNMLIDHLPCVSLSGIKMRYLFL
jgi:hypothetical protein